MRFPIQVPHIIAIECRSIEDRQWGVGRSVAKLLQELSKNPEIAQGYRFVLLFHRKIPDYEFLKSPLFKKRILCPGIFRFVPFYIYYFILVPIIAVWEKVYVTYYPYYMLPVIHFGKSVVVLTEDVFHEARKKDLGWHHKLAYRIFCWWSSIKATKIMTVSNTSAREVGRLFHIEANRIIANPHGVDIGEINKNAAEHDQNTFMYVGQAFPRRHLKETMEAFDILAENNNNIRLIAIGVDKYPQQILKSLSLSINKKHGRIVIDYRDYISDEELIDLYQKAFGCVYISFDEAFGIPPVEAAALGGIPIVANTPVTHEIFGDNAVFINDMHSAPSIVKAIEKIQNDSATQTTIRSNSMAIRTTYTWRSHAKRFIELIKKIDV